VCYGIILINGEIVTPKNYSKQMETDETKVVPESTTEVTPEVTETVEETTEETIEQVRERLAKAEEFGKNQKIRAERAEKKAKEPVSAVQSPDLSSKDIIALTRANVSDDDMDEVIDFAKYKKISVAEALKSSTVKGLLKEKEESRKTAQATNTGTARRGSVKLSDEEIVERAMRGELPEDPSVLARAQMNLKKKK
jgi:hypothetical protein